jgi:protein O-mannosyl-transferase
MMFESTALGHFMPLSLLTYAADHAVWGLDPFGYHLTNLLLHALNAVLLCRLAALLLRRIFPGEKEGALELGAAFAALAFALHPMRAESVAWATERRDVLAGAFYLCAILSYVKSALGRDARERRRAYAVSVAFFLCAALSKATVVPLPLALLALDYYPLKRLGAGEPPREVRARLVEKLPYFAIAAAVSLAAIRAQRGDLASLADHGLAGRLAQILYGAGFYVRKTLLPLNLQPLYPLGRPILFAAPAFVGVATTALAVLGLAAAGVPRRAQAALWGYYLALLLPVSGLVQNGFQLVALRYSYLSCLGWAVLAGAAAVAALKLRAKSPLKGAAILGALALWLAANAWALQGQIAVWRDDRSLWGEVLSRHPLSPLANVNLADALLRDGELPAAESRARLALRLDPASVFANLTLARTLAAERRADEAREVLERGLALNADWGEGEALLGVLLNAQGRTGEALAHLRRAAALLPSSAEAQGNAGAVLATSGRFAEALPYFERAAALDPARAEQLERVRRDLAASRPR